MEYKTNIINDSVSLLTRCFVNLATVCLFPSSVYDRLVDRWGTGWCLLPPPHLHLTRWCIPVTLCGAAGDGNRWWTCCGYHNDDDDDDDWTDELRLAELFNGESAIDTGRRRWSPHIPTRGHSTKQMFVILFSCNHVITYPNKNIDTLSPMKHCMSLVSSLISHTYLKIIFFFFNMLYQCMGLRSLSIYVS